MSKIKKVMIFLISLLLILLVFNIGCITNPSDNYYAETHDFTFRNIDNEQKKLSDYRGKVVLLDLWATWCNPCRLQMTELKKIYDAYGQDDLVILSIDVDYREDLSTIKNFMDSYEAQYQIDLDWTFGSDTSGEIWNKYKKPNEAIPTLYIFDQEGKVHFSHEGLAIYDQTPDWWTSADEPIRLSEYIDELLK